MAPEPSGRHSSRLPSCPEAPATRHGQLCGADASSGRWPEPPNGACEPGEGTVSLGPGRRRSWAGRRRSRLPGPPGSASAVAQPCRRLPAKGRKSYFAIQRSPRAPRASRHIGDRPWQGAGVALLVAHSCTRSMRASWAVVSCSRQMFSGSPPRCRPTAKRGQALLDGASWSACALEAAHSRWYGLCAAEGGGRHDGGRRRRGCPVFSLHSGEGCRRF